MKALILALQIVLGILPHVIETMKSIEIPGHGVDKKTLVVGVVTAALEELVPKEVIDTIGGAAKLANFVGRVVDLIVSFFNSVGIFKKAAA